MRTIQQLITQLMQSESEQTYQELLQTLRQQDTIWAAFSPVTQNCFTGMERGAFAAYLFSEESYFTQFQQDLAAKNIEVKAVANKAANRILLLGDLMRSGIQLVIIDNGQKHAAIYLAELLPELNETEPENPDQMIMNPKLLGRAHYFYQQVASQRASTVDETVMFYELIHGTYLLPTRNAGENTILPAIHLPDGKKALPVFTDWPELWRFDNSNESDVNIASFQAVASFSERLDVAVSINPRGVNIVLDRQLIDAVKKMAEGTFELPQVNLMLNENDPVTLSAADEKTDKMCEVIGTLLKEKKQVNAAYLLKMTKADAMRPSHLFILDVKGEADALYDEIAATASPHADGLDFEFVSFQKQKQFAEEAVRNIPPFYKKKRFFLFG